MSDVSSISSYNYLLSQETSSLFSGSGTASDAANALLSKARQKSAASAYGGGATSAAGQKALARALAELKQKGEGRISFDRIAAYKEELEKDFSLQVRTELLVQGIPPETDFTLNISAEGTVEVNCENQAYKERIATYLKDNPEIVEQFEYIQALSNVERARQSPASAGWNLKDAKAEIQAGALEAFFSSALDSGFNFAGMAASFHESSMSAAFYTGLNYKV